MNKNITRVGKLGMLVLGALLLSGCQNPAEQVGDKIAEGIINQATGGKVNVDSASGNVSIKTEDGSFTVSGDENNSTVTVTDKEGQTTNITGSSGAVRPADAPADLPSLEGAEDFAYFTMGTITSLNFSVRNMELLAGCDKLVAAVEAAGWQKSDGGFQFQTEDSIAKSYSKDNFELAVMCGTDGDGIMDFGLQKTEKS